MSSQGNSLYADGATPWDGPECAECGEPLGWGAEDGVCYDCLHQPELCSVQCGREATDDGLCGDCACVIHYSLPGYYELGGSE